MKHGPGRFLFVCALMLTVSGNAGPSLAELPAGKKALLFPTPAAMPIIRGRHLLKIKSGRVSLQNSEGKEIASFEYKEGLLLPLRNGQIAQILAERVRFLGPDLRVTSEFPVELRSSTICGVVNGSMYAARFGFAEPGPPDRRRRPPAGFTVYSSDGKVAFRSPPEEKLYPIAFTATSLLAYRASEGARQADEEFVFIDQKGKIRRKVVMPSKTVQANTRWIVSPSGKSVAFFCNRRGSASSMTLLTDAGGASILKKQACWSPFFAEDTLVAQETPDRKAGKMTLHFADSSDKKVKSVKLDLKGYYQDTAVAGITDRPSWALVVVRVLRGWTEEKRHRNMSTITFVFDTKKGKLVYRSEPVSSTHTNTSLVGKPAPWDQSAVLTLGPQNSYRLLKTGASNK